MASTATTMQHTPTPWNQYQINQCLVRSASGEIIADTYGDLPNAVEVANAAYIVRACNSHAALVNALQLLADKVEACGGYPGFRDELTAARAALHMASAQ